MPAPKASLIALAAAAVAVVAPASASAATRLVAPGGVASGNCLTAATACNLKYAVQGAAMPGDTVAVGTGAYPQAGSLSVPVPDLTIVGAPGARPLVSFDSSQANGNGVYAVAAGVTMRHLSVRTDGSDMTAIRASGGTFDDMIVRDPGADGTGIFTSEGATVTNSTVTSADGDAFWAGGDASTLRHVTAWGGTSGVYVGTGGGPNPVVSVLLHDSVAHGALKDIVLQSGGTQATRVSADADHSSFRPAMVGKSNTWAGLKDNGGNISATPLLANPQAGDAHELAGSPTIDAGSNAAADGAQDIDGEARVQGAATDIGADELTVRAAGSPLKGSATDPAPVLGSLTLKPKSFRMATVAASRHGGGTRIAYRDSEGATTHFSVQRRKVVKRHGRRVVRWVKVRGSFTHRDKAGANTVAFHGKLGRRVLQPGRYRLVGVARDAAGHRSAVRRAAFRVTPAA